MLICERCGTLIEDSELGTFSQCHGYTDLGDDFTERMAERCQCGGDFVEATRCELCGEWFDDTQSFGVCECCLEDFSTVPKVLEYGAENTALVNGINGAVAYLLTTDEINRILTKWVEENFVDKSKPIVKFATAEKDCFSEWLIAKEKESD